MDQGLRKNIQKTATTLFLKFGLRSVSIDDICNELRISKKTFYTQFNQKEELIESVLFEHAQKRFKKQKCRIKSCASKGNAIDNVLIASAVPLSPRNKQFVNFFFDLNKYYPEINRRNAQLNNDRLCDEIRQNIQEGIQQNIYRSDFEMELMIRFLGMQFNTLMDIAPGEISQQTLNQGLQLVMDCYVRVLCNQKGLDYYEKLLARRSKENPVEEEPLKDEELDYMIDKFLDNEDHTNIIM
jgi:TetR/AcrR family transcriptional regulator, cholesterol catabolism regulator